MRAPTSQRMRHEIHRGGMVCCKNLDSTTVAVHENEVYCKACYAKKYGPKGYGYGGGAGLLSVDRGESLGIKHEVAEPNQPTNNSNTSTFAQRFGGSEVCRRCNKTVHEAEKVIGAGSVAMQKTLVQRGLGLAKELEPLLMLSRTA
ncbi:hypothetical protein SRHO_G00146160 [Serrasalmus rhombeus]